MRVMDLTLKMMNSPEPRLSRLFIELAKLVNYRIISDRLTNSIKVMTPKGIVRLKFKDKEFQSKKDWDLAHNSLESSVNRLLKDMYNQGGLIVFLMSLNHKDISYYRFVRLIIKTAKEFKNDNITQLYE